MRRIAVVLGLSALLGLAPLVAHAQISIAGTSDVMDISLRDAEIGEVLIALFNTTNGKYQLQIGNGVVGRIARLQLTQTPFERALDAVLGTEYSYTKTQLQDGAYLYKISGRQTVTPATPAVGTRTTGMLAPPSGSVGATATATGTTTGGFAGATDFSTTLSWKTATTPGGATGGALGGGAAAGAPASSENSYVKLIRLSNLSVESFCDALGVESMPWISSLGENNNNNNDDNYNDNNDYNDNNNNNNDRYNNNNDDNNNRTTRNTRNTRNNNNNID